MNARNIAIGAAWALVAVYGWMPVCWVIGKVMGWC